MHSGLSMRLPNLVFLTPPPGDMDSGQGLIHASIMQSASDKETKHETVPKPFLGNKCFLCCCEIWKGEETSFSSYKIGQHSKLSPDQNISYFKTKDRFHKNPEGLLSFGMLLRAHKLYQV